MSSQILGQHRDSRFDVFKSANFDVENQVHFAAMVLKNTLIEYGLTNNPEIAIAVDDFTNEVVLFILGGEFASYDRFSRALTTFLASTNDNTPRYIMDLAYLCQDIVDNFAEGLDYTTELFRVLAEHNLYGMPTEF